MEKPVTKTEKIIEQIQRLDEVELMTLAKEMNKLDLFQSIGWTVRNKGGRKHTWEQFQKQATAWCLNRRDKLSNTKIGAKLMELGKLKGYDWSSGEKDGNGNLMPLDKNDVRKLIDAFLSFGTEENLEGLVTGGAWYFKPNNTAAKWFREVSAQHKLDTLGGAKNT
jgi:hypothetical protein